MIITRLSSRSDYILGRTVDSGLLKAIEDRNRGESGSHYNNNMIYLRNARPFMLRRPIYTLYAPCKRLTLYYYVLQVAYFV